MKRLADRKAICAAIVLLLCVEHLMGADTQDVRVLDEQGNTQDVLLSSIECARKSEAYVLGKILLDCRERMPHRAVEMTLCLRDCRAVVHPRCLEMRGAELAAIAVAANDPRADGELSFAVSNRWMSAGLSLVAELSGHTFAVDTYSNPKALLIRIGPPELVGKDWQRMAYHVPESLRGRMRDLPAQLQASGKTAAYDTTSSVLVVVDEVGANVFRLLDVMGLPKKEVSVDSSLCTLPEGPATNAAPTRQ